MALVKCPECGKEVSEKAPQCINCGFPISEHFRKGLPGKLIIHAPNRDCFLRAIKIDVVIDGLLFGTLKKNEMLTIPIQKDCSVLFYEHSALLGDQQSCSCTAYAGKTIEARITMSSNGLVYIFSCSTIEVDD